MTSTTADTANIVHFVEANIFFTSTAFSPGIFHVSILSLGKMISEPKRRALEARMSKLGLFEADIEEHFVRSGGAGGQNVNKVSTCVYIKHGPSGLEVKCQKTRSQVDNRYFARHILCDKLESRIHGRQSELERERHKIRKQKKRRSRKSKEKMLEQKHQRSEKKSNRMTPRFDD